MSSDNKTKNKDGSVNDSKLGQVIVRGLIIPSGWDEAGNVTTIAVSSFDESVYHIIKDEKGNQLIPLIRKEVEIMGFTKHENGLKKIKVDRYATKKSKK